MNDWMRSADGEDMAPSPNEASRQEVEQAVEAWRLIRAERLAQDKISAKLKEQETAIKGWLIDALRTQQYEGIVVGGRITSLSTKEQPVCSDRATLIDYILTTRQIELLQFRLSTTAIAEHVAAGETIPGVEYLPVYDLSDRKA